MQKETLSAALGRLSRVQLGTLPTPLHPLAGTQRAIPGTALYIKRDDMTGLGPGGNKIRSLEYILGDAVKNGALTVLASGPLQSNLCTLAAAACARLGLACELVHNAQQPAHPQGNVLLNGLLGARSFYVGAVDAAEREVFVQRRFAELTAAGGHPYTIKNGATTGLGVMGYVNAALELLLQREATGAAFDTIFAPGGNGGVAAGLIYGNALLGSPFRVVVISVEDTADVLEQHITDAIAQAQDVLGLPFTPALSEACELVDAYRGGGWGENTPESEAEVRRFARDEGIFIENVYNSKVLVGMKDMLLRGAVRGGACYLHTGGFGSLFSQF